MDTELVGMMAVAVVIVEGAPGTAEAFTDAERDAARLAVVRAELTWGRLARALSPNRFLQCSFVNTFETIVIDPGPVQRPTDTRNDLSRRDAEIRTIEQQWRPAAMAALGVPGQPGGPDPRSVYCESLLHRDWGVPYKPRRGIIIFLTKFPTGWIAYATSVGAPSATVQVDWAGDTGGNFAGTGVGGLGWDNLDRVVAHELGHLFGALDEAGRCHGTDVGGPLSTPNSNCAVDNPQPVSCLMLNNSESLCPASVAHVGWVDSDGNGVVDAAAPEPVLLSPVTGSPGDVIGISGSGLGETRSVVFTGIGAAQFTIVSDRSLEVTVPAGEGADRDVYVTTCLGVSSPDPALRFSYV